MEGQDSRDVDQALAKSGDQAGSSHADGLLTLVRLRSHSSSARHIPSTARQTGPRNETGRNVMLRTLAALLLSLALLQAPAFAAEATGEQRTTEALDALRTDPLALRAFLAAMPKGADLHNHLDSAVYAETFIRVGVEDRFCIDTETMASPSRNRPTRARVHSRFAVWAMSRSRKPSRSSAYSTVWSTHFPCAVSCRRKPLPATTISLACSPSSVAPIPAIPASFSTRCLPAPRRRTSNISS